MLSWMWACSLLASSCKLREPRRARAAELAFAQYRTPSGASVLERRPENPPGAGKRASREAHEFRASRPGPSLPSVAVLGGALLAGAARSPAGGGSTAQNSGLEGAEEKGRDASVRVRTLRIPATACSRRSVQVREAADGICAHKHPTLRTQEANRAVRKCEGPDLGSAHKILRCTRSLGAKRGRPCRPALGHDPAAWVTTYEFATPRRRTPYEGDTTAALRGQDVDFSALTARPDFTAKVARPLFCGQVYGHVRAPRSACCAGVRCSGGRSGTRTGYDQLVSVRWAAPFVLQGPSEQARKSGPAPSRALDALIRAGRARALHARRDSWLTAGIAGFPDKPGNQRWRGRARPTYS